MKPTSSRERENRFDNLATGIFYIFYGSFQISTIENEEHTSSLGLDGRVRFEKAAIYPAIIEAALIRPKVFKSPSK